MLFPQLLPLVLATLVVAQDPVETKITFYADFDYKGMSTNYVTSNPSYRGHCENIFLYIEGPIKSAQISRGSECYMFKERRCEGEAVTIFFEDEPHILPEFWAKSVECNFPIQGVLPGM
ncbi:hypothetical protein VE04_06331 [Pseudogymnoascus sp. 24MN13]|nr:hypothetical protein VE04_06331 [Pseudogymnoascus sp. 24MN13]